jgi:hypothetical protein
MIRHAAPSSTVAAISFGMHGAATRGGLIASPSFPLPVTAPFLRAGSGAADLAPIAPPTNKNLGAAARAQEHPARHFIEARGTACASWRRPTLDQVLQDLAAPALRALAPWPDLAGAQSLPQLPICRMRPGLWICGQRKGVAHMPTGSATANQNRTQ